MAWSDGATGLGECHEWPRSLVEQWRLSHECGAAQEDVQRSVSGKLAGYDEPASEPSMNRRGTEPYARWCERTGEVTPPPTRSASDFAYVCSKEEPVAFRFTANDFTDGFQGWELITTRVKNRLKLLSDRYFLLDKELHAGCAQVTANPSEAVALTVDNLNLRVYLHTVEIALFRIILHG